MILRASSARKDPPASLGQVGATLRGVLEVPRAYLRLKDLAAQQRAEQSGKLAELILGRLRLERAEVCAG